MNLLQKAIVKNIRKEYELMPYSEQYLKDLLKSALNATDDPRLHVLFMEAYNEYCAENREYKAEQEAIYGTEFDEQIALKRGSKPVKRILKRLIKALKDCPAEIQEKYLSKVKLLLSALKDKQSYNDDEIDKALDDTDNFALDLYFNGCLSYDIRDNLQSLWINAYDIEYKQQNNANA